MCSVSAYATQVRKHNDTDTVKSWLKIYVGLNVITYFKRDEF